MKKLSTLVFLLFFTFGIFAQEDVEGYQFTVVKENPITPVKNQGNSGTCWSFSGIGFLESELMRAGKGAHDLSAMYVVRRNYKDKAVKFIRVDGALNFSQGGSFADVIETLDEYGVIPDSVYNGLNYGEKKHNHGELEAGLTGYIKGIQKNKNKRLSTAWLAGFDGILDAYFGKIPTEFTYMGKNYTPQSLAKALGLSAGNYLSFTSYTHHPFYQSFALEVPDNWRWAQSFNLPVGDMIKTIDNAINNGYTVAWATDVSEIGFTPSGIAVIPDDDAPENIGSDQAHWLGLSQNEKNATLMSKLEMGPIKEKSVTQEMRQIAFDNYETTDDHGMLIYGIAKDQLGNKYYMVKNSWGDSGKYKGIWYASESFVRFKTMSILVNKNAVPKDIFRKLK